MKIITNVFLFKKDGNVRPVDNDSFGLTIGNDEADISCKLTMIEGTEILPGNWGRVILEIEDDAETPFDYREFNLKFDGKNIGTCLVEMVSL